MLVDSHCHLDFPDFAAELPDIVRGYEDIKLRSVERFRTEASRLEAELAELAAR